MVETIVAIGCIFLFSGFFWQSDLPVAKLGAAIIVVSCVFIIYKLHHTRTIQQPTRLDASLREYCKTEVARMDRQIELLRSVLWWYIMPIIVGVNIMFTGIAGLGAASRNYCIVTLLMAWGIYLLNQRAVSKSLVPLRDELASLFDDMGKPL